MHFNLTTEESVSNLETWILDNAGVSEHLSNCFTATRLWKPLRERLGSLL